MNENAQPVLPGAPACVEAMLVGIQQAMLANGYEYMGADQAAWPNSPVHMIKGDIPILIWPWSDYTPEAIDLIRRICRQTGVRGVLLIGDERADDSAVRSLLKSLGCYAAYIDASTEEFCPSRTRSFSFATAPPPVTKEGIQRLLQTRKTAKAVCIDCRQKLHEHTERRNEAAAFFDRSRAISGSGRPLVTYGLVALCVLIFAATAAWWWFGQLNWDIVLLRMGASYGPKERDGQVWRFLTCGFLHAGVIHLWMNMMALVVFGQLLEMFQGRWRFGTIYILSILGGSVASLWVHPTTLGVGASGGIFGLAGGIAAIAIRHRRDFPPHVWKSFRRFFFTFIAYNILFQFLPAIDAAAHAGGLVTGLLAGLIIVRSPVRKQPVSAAAMAAGGLMVAALVLAAILGLQRIPADAPGEPHVSSLLLDRRAAPYGAGVRLCKPPRPWNRLWPGIDLKGLDRP